MTFLVLFVLFGDGVYTNEFWKLNIPNQSPKIMPFRYNNKTCIKMLKVPQILFDIQVLGLNPKYMLVQNVDEISPESYIEEINDYIGRLNQAQVVNLLFHLIKIKQ